MRFSVAQGGQGSLSLAVAIDSRFFPCIRKVHLWDPDLRPTVRYGVALLPRLPSRLGASAGLARVETGVARADSWAGEPAPAAPSLLSCLVILSREDSFFFLPLLSCSLCLADPAPLAFVVWLLSPWLVLSGSGDTHLRLGLRIKAAKWGCGAVPSWPVNTT